MQDFLIGLEHTESQGYVANFFSGASIQLGATTYHDAVLEADMLTQVDLETA